MTVTMERICAKCNRRTTSAFSLVIILYFNCYNASGEGGGWWGVVDASFHYEYNRSTMNVVAIDATIGDRTLRTLHYNYTSHTGRINRIQVNHRTFNYLITSIYVHYHPRSPLSVCLPVCLSVSVCLSCSCS